MKGGSRTQATFMVNSFEKPYASRMSYHIVSSSSGFHLPFVYTMWLHLYTFTLLSEILPGNSVECCIRVLTTIFQGRAVDFSKGKRRAKVLIPRHPFILSENDWGIQSPPKRIVFR